jgi:hypothetical protein
MTSSGHPRPGQVARLNTRPSSTRNDRPGPHALRGSAGPNGDQGVEQHRQTLRRKSWKAKSSRMRPRRPRVRLRAGGTAGRQAQPQAVSGPKRAGGTAWTRTYGCRRDQRRLADIIVLVY